MTRGGQARGAVAPSHQQLAAQVVLELPELLAQAGPLDLDLSRVPRLFGVPRFIYRQAAGQLLRYVKRLGRTDALALLIEELKMLQYAGLFSECWKRRIRRTDAAAAAAAAAPGLLGR